MKFINTIGITAFAFLLITSCNNKEEVTEETLRPVKYEAVGENNGSQTRTFSGTAEASDEIDLSFRSSGKVVKLNVVAGQKVNKGDLLMQLDNVQAQLTYEQSVSALNSAKSAMITAKSSLTRSKALYEKGSHSLSDYEYEKNAYQNALDNYETAMRKMELDRTNINYGYIYAPKSGTIADVDISLNETVASGQVVGILNAGEGINIDVGIPENVINQIRVGATVEIDFPSIQSDKPYTGTVVEIAPIIVNRLNTYPVKIDIAGDIDKVRPGMAAKVEFSFNSETQSESDKSLVVPIKSVGEDGNGNFVFVIEPVTDQEGVARKQTIEIGDVTPDGFQVKSGLAKGQLIATAGLHSLLDGQMVRLK